MSTDSLYQSILPILQHEESGKVSIAGTSILVEHRGLPFLVTAAHVLRDNGSKYPLSLSLEEKNVVLSEPALMTKDTDVELDLAIFDVSRYPDLRASLAGYSTISLNDPDSLPVHARSHLFVFGFPWRKAFYDREESLIKIKPLKYVTDEADEALYKKHSRSLYYHHIVKYKPKATINQENNKVTAPEPQGVSGGPLFRMYIDENDYAILLVLDGVLIEWKNRECIVATRKSALSRFIESAIFGPAK